MAQARRGQQPCPKLQSDACDFSIEVEKGKDEDQARGQRQHYVVVACRYCLTPKMVRSFYRG